MKNNLEVWTLASLPLAIFSFVMWREYRDPADPMIAGHWLFIVIVWTLLFLLCINERLEKL